MLSRNFGEITSSLTLLSRESNTVIDALEQGNPEYGEILAMHKILSSNPPNKLSGSVSFKHKSFEPLSTGKSPTLYICTVRPDCSFFRLN
jgi:hypothetical protein